MFLCRKKAIQRLIAVLALWGFSALTFAPSAQAVFQVFDLFKKESTVPLVERRKLVSFLVEEQLLENVSLEKTIKDYIVDVQTDLEVKGILIPVPPEASSLDIAEGNAQMYFSGYENDGLSQLIGTILIGDVPLPVVDKNGNLWPTIYPYTDFERPSYRWDKDADRFVYQEGGDGEPEIWHGVIRANPGRKEGPNETLLQKQKEQDILDYLNQNHEVHAGNVSFSEKVFYADLPRQKIGIDTVALEQYENFIDHIEDVAYMRFNKYWAQDLLGSSSMNENTPWNLLPDDVRPTPVPDMSGEVLKMPDIHSKSFIEGFAKRYYEAWKNYLSLLHTRIATSGRWDTEDIDTTIALVAKKDETSASLLKSFNDSLETVLNSILQDNENYNISENISIEKEPEGEPNYWNGVDKSELTAENCSLLRGTLRTESYPYAQLVEGNRTYNPDTLDSCDGYAGCCADNIEMNQNTLELSASSCDVASATNPVFDIAGTREIDINDSGYDEIGAKGCNSIIEIENEDSDIFHRFDSLVFHQEPTSATISSQLEVLSSQSVPIDDPRGFSFYDHGKNFQRLNYFNVFDLRNWYDDVKLYEASEENLLKISDGNLKTITEEDENTLSVEQRSELREKLRKELLKSRIKRELTAKIQEINEVTTAGNVESDARFETDFHSTWPNTLPETPPAGYGGFCAYTSERTTLDNNTEQLDWIENCDWWEGGVIDNPELPDQTSDPRYVRIYETVEGNVYDEATLITDRSVEWAGDAITLPGGYIGDPPDCEYSLQESILDTNEAKLEWTASCEWTGFTGGDPFADPPDPGDFGSGTILSKVVRFYETVSTLPSADDVWPGTGYDESCNYTADELSIDNVTTQIDWTETCPGPVVRTESHIFENATFQTTPFENMSWPTTPFDVPLGGSCGYSVELAQDLAELDINTRRTTWEESCVWNGGLNTNEETIIRYYEDGETIPENYFETVANYSVLLEKTLDDVAESLIWLDKDIQEKNKLVFKNAFAPNSEARNFFLDNSFQSGYELTEIIGEPYYSSQNEKSGIKMVFEQGADPEDEDFQSAQKEAGQFLLQSGTGIGESKFDFGRDDDGEDEAFCENKNILKWIPCFLEWMASLPDYLNQKLVFLPDLPDLNIKRVLSPFDEKIQSDKISSIRVTPANIQISNKHIDPIPIEISLLNGLERVIESDFTSSVELTFESSLAKKFFRIEPSQKSTVIGGKAHFSLIPKTSDVGGSFTFTAKSGKVLSDPVPVSVERFSLKGKMEEESLVAKGENVVVNVSVRDFSEKLSSEKDGSEIRFQSDWGVFPVGDTVKIQNGKAKIQFSPGKRSGKASIHFQDIAKEFPEETLAFDIIPAEPAQLLLDTDTNLLVFGSEYIPLSVTLTDAFENVIPDVSQDLEWESETLDIRGEIGDSLEQKNVGSTSTIFIRPRKGILEKGKIKVSTNILREEEKELSESSEEEQNIEPEDKKGVAGLIQKIFNTEDGTVSENLGIQTSQEFTVLQKAFLNISEGETEIVAGKSVPLEISIRAESNGGKRITSDFPIYVSAIPEGIGIFEKNFTLSDGLGTFEFFSGTKAGKVTLLFSAPGFETSSLELEVLPASPEKITASVDRTEIDINEELPEIFLELRVIDAFGNTAVQFNDDVYLTPNQPDIFTDEEGDLLVDLEIIPDQDQQLVFLEGEAEEQTAEGGNSPDYNIIDFDDEEGRSYVPLWHGKSTIKITPQSGTGKVFLTAKAPNLIPDAVELEITNPLSIEDVGNFTPKSLLTLLLGFNGGNLAEEKSMANEWLHTGQTQAVGTLIVDPNISKRIGMLQGTGALSEPLTPEFQFGDQLEMNILSTTETLATAQIRFRKELPDDRPVPFFVVKELKDDAGIYFIPAEDQIDVLTRIKGQRIVYQNDIPIFSVTDNGGIETLSGGVSLTSIDNSIFKWKVSFAGEELGMFQIIPDNTEIQEVTTDTLKKTKKGGIFLVREKIGIRIDSAFTGKTTNDLLGVVFIEEGKKEDAEKILGNSFQSVEEGGENEDVVWKETWKPGIYFAGGNTIGLSTQWGASDAFILFGDPSLSVQSTNPRSTLNITPDIGTQIWKSPDGPIEQILSGDVNGDGFPDILSLVGNQLFLLYQDDTETDSFREVGPVLRFSDGVEYLGTYDNDNDGFTDILQLNEKGQLILHRNVNGTFVRQQIVLEELEGEIAYIRLGNIDDDVYTGDLIISDINRNLFTAYGTKNPEIFESLYKVENYGPYFDEVDEKFVVTEEQGEGRKYTELEKFPQLLNFFVSYDGIEKDWNDATPDQAVQMVHIDTTLASIASQNSNSKGNSSNENSSEKENDNNKEEDNSGNNDGNESDSGEYSFTSEEGIFSLKILFGGVTASYEALKDMIKKLKDSDEDSDDPVADQLKSIAEVVKDYEARKPESQRNTIEEDQIFLALPFQPRFDAELKMAQPVHTKLGIGSEVNISLSLFAPMDMSNTELLIPQLEGFIFDPKSFQCQNCEGEQTFDIQEEADIGAFKVSGINIYEGKKITFTWKIQIGVLEKLVFSVFDFAGNDEIDDILIAIKDEEGNKKFIQYVSFPRNKNLPIEGNAGVFDLIKNTKASIIGSFKRFFHLQRTVNVNDPSSPAVPTANEMQNLVFQADFNGNGLVDTYDTFGTDNWGFGEIECKSCGLPIPSIALLAPGSQSLYVPPFSLQVPPLPAFPIFAVPTAGIIPVWPPNPVGIHTTSAFRLYLMPTTTGQLGIGLCFGVEPAFMYTAPLWAGNCFVTVPPVSVLGMCPADDGGGGIAEGGGNLDKIMDGDWDSIIKKPKKFEPKIKNKSITGVSIIDDWIRRQIAEWGNIKAPTVSLVLPKFSSEKDKDKLQEVLGVNLWGKEGEKGRVGISQRTVSKKQETSVEFEEDSTVLLGRDFWKSLDESPWVTVKPKKFTFPIPRFPSEEEKYKEQWQRWENQCIKWKQDLGDFLGKDTLKDGDPKKCSSYSWEDREPDAELEAEKAEKKRQFEEARDKACNEQPGDERTFLDRKEDCANFWAQVEGLQEFMGSVEQNLQAIEDNWEAIKSYKDVREELKNMKDKILNVKDSFDGFFDDFNDYIVSWVEENKKVIGDWDDFREKIMGLWKAFEGILDPFKKFKVRCSTCAVERGSSIVFLLKIFLSGVKLPIIPAPKIPNIILDFSRINFGLKIEVPEIETPDVDMSYIDIPAPPNISINIDIFKLPALPAIPVLPVLPKMPTIDFQLPQFSFPVIMLPTLIEPPGVPSLFVSLEAIMSILKKIIDFLCWIVSGFAIVPEWYLAGHVSQLTNRTQLFGLDFTTPSLLSTLPGLPEIDDIEVILEANLQIPTLIMETINAGIEGLETVWQCSLSVFSQMLKGEIADIQSCTLSSGGEIALGDDLLVEAKKEILPEVVSEEEKETITLTVEDFSTKKFSEEVLDTEYNEAIQSLAQSLKDVFEERNPITPEEKRNFFAQIEEILPKKNIFASFPVENHSQNWTASTSIDIESVPHEIPEDFDTEQLEEDQSEYSEATPALYYFDPETETMETITDFPMEDPMTLLLANIRDGETEAQTGNEILYALGNELYLKYRAIPISDPDDLEDRYEEKYGGDYKRRNQTVFEWNFESFAHAFAPSQEMNSDSSAEGSSFSFVPDIADESYFEWVISDRPDAIFEINMPAQERKSQVWNREGFLIRSESEKYEIRPMSARVTKVEGAPILYVSPPEEIPLFKPEDCANPEKEKPFFDTESILVGIDGTSRMEIRVPPRPDQEEEFREVTLRAGEETVVEYAEVCLTRGNVERVSTNEIQKTLPEKNLYLPDGARIELGPNEKVEITFFDGTKVVLKENERYTIHYFKTEEEAVETFKNLKQGNYYGFFQGFKRDGKSFIRSKFLHDPQIEDDLIPPHLKIVGGTEVRVSVYEKVQLDATNSWDEQGIEKVWWDLYPEKDSNNDGDFENDEDFPSVSNKTTYTPRDLLKVVLPAYQEVGRFAVVLNAKDPSGNMSKQKVNIQVSAPELKLYETSVRSQKVSGKVETGSENIPIHIERKRNGEWVLLDEESILSKQGGDFEIENLSVGGGVEVKNAQGKIDMEILPTGRPIIYNDLFDFVIEPSTEEHAFQIALRNEQKEIFAILQLVSELQAEVVIDTSALSFSSEGVHVLDTDISDHFLWKSFSGNVALVDTERNKTVGVITPEGDFFVLETTDVSFKVKPAEKETEPMVFEVFVNNIKRGEFFIGLGKESNVQFQSFPLTF